MIARFASSRILPWLAFAAFALLAVLISPIGYVGGHNDDWRYLEAARCWVANAGPCLATNHWATRWPTLAPIAVLTGALGESRLTLGLAMLPTWIAVTVLLGWLGRLWLGRTAGLTAAAVLLATPVVTQSALQPNVDLPELAFQLAALVAATHAYRSQRRSLAIVAGVLAALAVQCRDTSVLFCAAAALAWLFLPAEHRRILLWALAGFALAMGVELIAYAVATGDPLFRYRLALHHGAIPTDELPATVAFGQTPLLNPAYIANWRREMGIALWWPLDPWLNLVASPRIGFTLIAGTVLGASQWRHLDRPARRLLATAVAGAALIVVALVYVLAIDPKPRMFLLLVAAAALVIGASLSAARRAGRGAVPQIAVVLLLILGFVTLSRFTTTRDYERLATRWLAEHPGELTLDPNAVSTLALVPGTAALPHRPGERRFRIAGGNEPCAAYEGRTVDRSAVIGGGQLCLQDTATR